MEAAMWRKLRFLLILSVGVFAPISAYSQGFVTIKHNKDGCTDGLCIDALALTSDRATPWINVEGYRAITFSFQLVDADNSVTAIEMTCETTYTGSTVADSGDDVCSGTTAVGTTTMVCPHTWSFANAYADHANVTVDNLNANFLKCKFHGTGLPGAVDTITVRMIKKTP
jgi:hypothetical protein